MRVLLMLTLVACGASPAPKPTVSVPSTPAAEVAPAATGLPANIPDTATGRQLAWILGVLDGKHGAITSDEVKTHFDPSFLAAVSVDQVIAVAQQLAPGFAGARVAAVQAVRDGLSAKIASTTARWRARITLAPDGLIAGLLFTPIVAESFDEVAPLLAKLAPKASLLVARLDSGTCVPLHAIHETDELAIGSTFKLYVLIALADQVMRGKLKWDQELAVRDDWKSLPSGITQGEPAGTKLTIRELANRMISISDNTATDHLLYTVGRKSVEAALHTANHAQPLLDVPFLGTRELFVFKTLLAPDEIERYLALKASPRRAYLDGALAKRTPTLAGAMDWKTARHIEDLEWFASPADLCGAMATLEDRAAHVPEVRDILAINPGIPLSPAAWKYIGFKGGSEPGVLAGTWLLRRDDGKTFVVSLVANDAGGPEPDEKRAFGLAGAVIELLATEAR